jgi:hypothetical protein
MLELAEMRRQLTEVACALDQAAICLDADNGSATEMSDATEKVGALLLRARHTTKRLRSTLDEPPPTGRPRVRLRATEPGC